MHKNLPTNLSEHLESNYRCVWLGVVLMKNNCHPVGQSWALLVGSLFQTLNLLIVQIGIKCLAVSSTQWLIPHVFCQSHYTQFCSRIDLFHFMYFGWAERSDLLLRPQSNHSEPLILVMLNPFRLSVVAILNKDYSSASTRKSLFYIFRLKFKVLGVLIRPNDDRYLFIRFSLSAVFSESCVAHKSVEHSLCLP